MSMSVCACVSLLDRIQQNDVSQLVFDVVAATVSQYSYFKAAVFYQLRTVLFGSRVVYGRAIMNTTRKIPIHTPRGLTKAYAQYSSGTTQVNLATLYFRVQVHRNACVTTENSSQSHPEGEPCITYKI